MKLQSNEITLKEYHWNHKTQHSAFNLAQRGIERAFLITMAKQEYFCVASKACGTIDWQVCLNSSNYYEMSPKSTGVLSKTGALFSRDAFYETLLFAIYGKEQVIVQSYFAMPGDPLDELLHTS